MVKLNDQVNNGGFHQFFVNMGGAFDKHLADDILMIPNTSHRDIVQRAYDIYSKIDYQDQWDNRGKSWDYFTAPIKEGRFRDEDAAFYKSEPEFDAIIGAHVRKELANAQ
jgi:hypothetical protein